MNHKKMQKLNRNELIKDALSMFGDPAAWPHRLRGWPPRSAKGENLFLVAPTPYKDEDFDPIPPREEMQIGVNAWIELFYLGWIFSGVPIFKINVPDAWATGYDATVAAMSAGQYQCPYRAFLLEPSGVDMALGDRSVATHVATIFVPPHDLGPSRMGYLVAMVATFSPSGRMLLLPPTFIDFLSSMIGAAAIAPYLLSEKLMRKTLAPARSRARKRREKKWVVPAVWELDIPRSIRISGSEDGAEPPDMPHAADVPRPIARRQHVCAGHWREQACGPGWTARKRTWVSPHWRCKDSPERSSFTVSVDAK